MSIESIRTKIDEIDTALVALLALRNEQSLAIKAFKNGVVQDTDREEKLRKKWETQARALGINPHTALKILDLLLEESRRVQQS